MKKANIAVLVSGGGTNLQALLDAQAAGNCPTARSRWWSHPIRGLMRWDGAGEGRAVPACTVSKKACGSQEAFEVRLSEELAAHQIDLIVLAGFLTILSAAFTAQWPERILNIHPSLIPAFCGKGMYGLKVHEARPAPGA